MKITLFLDNQLEKGLLYFINHLSIYWKNSSNHFNSENTIEIWLMYDHSDLPRLKEALSGKLPPEGLLYITKRVSFLILMMPQRNQQVQQLLHLPHLYSVIELHHLLQFLLWQDHLIDRLAQI